MKKITIITTFYNQNDFLKKVVLDWISWTDAVRDQFSFCILDDYSETIATEVLKDTDLSNLDLSIYRVTDDIPWNQHGATNLGIQECSTEYVMVIDMDTIVSENLAVELLKLANLNVENVAYRFNRMKKDGSVYKIHPKVCLINKKEFWEVGGYDEDFCGNYGGNDMWFWYRWAHHNKQVENKSDLYLGMRNEFGRAPNMVRCAKHNTHLFKIKQKRKDVFPKDFIRFGWEKLL